jgi:hypothetical protein
MRMILIPLTVMVAVVVMMMMRRPGRMGGDQRKNK